MTDRPEETEEGDAEAARKLPSARERASDGRRERGRRRGRGGRRRDRRSTPTPARSLAEGPATEPVEADRPEASLELKGGTWTVRVLGRSGGGLTRGATPLLLLGFWAPGTDGEAHAREALTVGRTLSCLSEADLREAHARSRPPGPPRGERAFFGRASELRGG